MNRRLNFEDVELETMESELSTLLVKINHRFDALQLSLASKDHNFMAEIDNLITTLSRR